MLKRALVFFEAVESVVVVELLNLLLLELMIAKSYYVL